VIVELRAVPDCPNLDATRTLLHACLTEAGLTTPAAVTVVERIGDYPSPSILIDGRDVTGAHPHDADPHDAAGCVLRPPTADQIRAALRTALTDTPDPDTSRAGVLAVDCCPPGEAIRADRPVHAAALPPAVGAVYRYLLRHFATTGTTPTPADLANAAHHAGTDPHTVLRRLAADDLVAIDNAGRLVAAYPFSPTPTPHTVDLDGVRVYAMCAVDALGIPAMLATHATIHSTDPHTGQPVTVTITAGHAHFDPPTTIVVYAATTGSRRSVDTCCSTINFFIDPTTAHAWIHTHTGLTATILDQTRALTLGRDIFGPLLTEPASHQDTR
jgi:hypothetical protein